MHLWEFLCVIGIVFVLLEIFLPSMFFLNFALAAFIVAPISIITKNPFSLVLIFFIMSFLSFAFLRPILIKRKSKDTETGMEGKYIGKIVTTTEEISENSGIINIYGERWEARSEDKSAIPSGSEVRIVRNDSLIMYVEKV